MYYDFSNGARVSLTDHEYNFLKEFKQSIAMTDLNEDQLTLAHMLVNKMVLYRKKKNGNLHYVKENKK
tara:strand:- start:1290 stop:1493 length:204 start_codon:yes stop_codon:yes gene_type:complete